MTIARRPVDAHDLLARAATPAMSVLAVMLVAVVGVLMAPAPGIAVDHHAAAAATAAGNGGVQPGAPPRDVDHSAVDWDKIAPAPDPSPLAVAAYGS